MQKSVELLAKTEILQYNFFFKFQVLQNVSIQYPLHLCYVLLTPVVTVYSEQELKRRTNGD